MVSAYKGLHVFVMALCALAAFHMGVVGLMGFNVLDHLSMTMDMPMFGKIMRLVVGAAGVLSLIDLVMCHGGTKCKF